MPKTKKTETEETLTPMMQQFRTLKEQNPDALLLFRCGDFYETYLSDAVAASKTLGLTLTHRNNKGQVASIEMAGFPHHALDSYLPRLIRAGYRVAICDQLEDPKLCKTLVKRGVTEVVTPGVVLSDGMLPARENNFLASVHFGKGRVGMALLDISTGEFLASEGTAPYVAKLLAGYRPKELLCARGMREEVRGSLGAACYTYPLDDWFFSPPGARRLLLRHFDVKSLKGFGVDELECAVTAAGAALEYLSRTHHDKTAHITSLRRLDEDASVRLDPFTVRALELLDPLSEGGRSLLSVVDRTLTPMGGRLLRRWLVFPLRDLPSLRARGDVVETLLALPQLREQVRASLEGMGDVERLASKVAVGRATPKDLLQLLAALQAIEPLQKALLASGCGPCAAMGGTLDPCLELRGRLERELSPTAPLLLSRGGVINEGVNAELDELRALRGGSKEHLERLCREEAERTGIGSLKIGYNNVFGYYLEVRNTFRDKVPEEWRRKQTLVSAERYITPELKALEDRILSSEDRILALEGALFSSLLALASQHITSLQENSAALARLDCLHSFALTAQEGHYTRPVLDESRDIIIRAGRHPVIETQMEEGERYIANDLDLTADERQILVVTGPNMAGKSALLRQTALIVLLAQCGSFVPAEEARLGLVDKIFARVGASDNISRGESTFMVEMSEAASILHNLTSRSLVIFDELGRGTSTYDGIALAWAIVEQLHQGKERPRTLFATHYHELGDMAGLYPRVKNCNVTVREKDGRVVFLRKLQEGCAAHSFGIHVARMAGLPPQVLKRSEELLADMERESRERRQKDATPAAGGERSARTPGSVQLSFYQLDDPILQAVRDEILDLDPDRLTPLEALCKLAEIKKIVTGK